jgi:hypothetical protein
MLAYFPYFEVGISDSLHARETDHKWITISNIILGYFAPLEEKTSRWLHDPRPEYKIDTS